MATSRKRKNKWTIEIRRKKHQNVYGTFVHKVEGEIIQNKYKDISEAATITFNIALHR